MIPALIIGHLITKFYFLGDGAYSEVYKVKRLSDNQIYALKKVRETLILLFILISKMFGNTCLNIMVISFMSLEV